MRYAIRLFCIACLLVVVGTEARAEIIPGINFAGPADWNTELPLVDVFRMSRPWISQQEGKPWGQGPTLDLDEHGWVKSLQPGCYAETPVCTIEGGHYPSGQYTLLYKGRGKIDTWGAAKVVERADGRIILDVDSSRGGMFIRLMETDPADPVRDIQLIMPGFEKTVDSNPWHPAFLARWKGMKVVRFMDMMHTNGSHIEHWSDRPQLGDATTSRKGLPLELLCDLAGRLEADPWFCMPHLADDDYIRRFATQVKELLPADRKIYIEYSNEVWNGQFPQSRYAGEQGIKLGLAEKPWEAAWKYTGVRSKQIFAIWEEVFGGRQRLVRVLATQAANPYVSRQVVTAGDAYKSADALAVAPYMSMNTRPDQADALVRSGLDGILTKAENESLPKSIEWIKGQKEVADEYNLRLVAYEAGQHLVGVGGGENNQALEDLFHQANRSERMGQIYSRYFEAWSAAGGDEMCIFSSTGKWSKWGSWGLMQYYDDDPKDYPKCREAMKLLGR